MSKRMSNDAWGNLFTALGRDLGYGAEYGPAIAAILNPNQLLNNNPMFLSRLYSSGGIFSLIIDIVIGEMTRGDFTVNEDPEGKVPRYLEASGAFSARQRAAMFARIFGGSVSVMLANDQTSQIWRPLREDRIVSFDGLQVFDRFRVSWSPDDLYKDPKNPKYGFPEVYTISPAWAPMGGRPFRVHESRCLVLDGEPVTDYRRIDNIGWGDSELIRCLTELIALAEGNRDIGKLLRTFVTNVLTIPGLMKMIMEGDVEKIRERIDLAKESLQRSNFWLLDGGTGIEKGEAMEKMVTSVSGIIELPKNQQAMVSAVTKIPQTRLFGKSASGLNATGDGDENNFLAYVDELRNNRLRPFDTRMMKVAMLAKSGPTNGMLDPKAAVIYPDLKRITPKEQAELEGKRATTAKTLIDLGALHPDEVREWAGSLPYVKLDKKFEDATTRPRASSQPPGGDPEDEGEEDPNDPKAKPGEKKEGEE